MRSTVERRDSIIQLIRKDGKVRVDNLAEQFDVSSVTIRNDLDFLEKKGILHRTHGGALIRKNVYEDPTLEEKRSEEHTSELQSRGHLVCRLLLEKKNIVTR